MIIVKKIIGFLIPRLAKKWFPTEWQKISDCCAAHVYMGRENGMNFYRCGACLEKTQVLTVKMKPSWL